MSLLQLLVRVELIERALQLSLRRFVSGHLGAMKARAQSLELVVDLAASGFECVGQRWIDTAQLLAQLIKFTVNRAFSLGKRLRGLGAQVFLDHPLQHTLGRQTNLRASIHISPARGRCVAQSSSGSSAAELA